MALVGSNSNVFALLNDDVEDAGEGSVNTAALAPKKKPVASTTTSETKPAPREGSGAPQKRQTGSNNRGSGGRGRGRGGGDRGDYEQGPVAKGQREPRNARHTDRRDHPTNTVNSRSNNRREHDRRSGTGRGREVAKHGAGGKYVFGNDKTEARSAEQNANAALQSGADEETAVNAAVGDAVDVGAEGAVPKDDEATGENENAEGTEAEAEDPEDQDITIEEFERQKAEAMKASVPDIFNSAVARTVDDGDLKELKKEEEADPFASVAKNKAKAKKGAPAASSPIAEKKSATANFFSGEGPKPSNGPRRNERQNSRGSGSNNRGGGYSGGRSRQPPVPRMDDVSAFPSLGS